MGLLFSCPWVCRVWLLETTFPDPPVPPQPRYYYYCCCVVPWLAGWLAGLLGCWILAMRPLAMLSLHVSSNEKYTIIEKTHKSHSQRKKHIIQQDMLPTEELEDPSPPAKVTKSLYFFNVFADMNFRMNVKPNP